MENKGKEVIHKKIKKSDDYGVNIDQTNHFDSETIDRRVNFFP